MRLTRDEKNRWTVGQMPQAESAFLAISPLDGAILALTGGAGSHQIADYLAAGMDGHVVRPTSAARLYAAIDAALRLEATDSVAAMSAA